MRVIFIAWEVNGRWDGMPDLAHVCPQVRVRHSNTGAGQELHTERMSRRGKLTARKVKIVLLRSIGSSFMMWMRSETGEDEPSTNPRNCSVVGCGTRGLWEVGNEAKMWEFLTGRKIKIQDEKRDLCAPAWRGKQRSGRCEGELGGSRSG
jgi:hypothetical protein